MKGRIWQAETDLERLKHLAHLLLGRDITSTKFSPLVVSHPFSDSGIVGVQDKDGRIKIINLLDNLGDAEKWREQVGQQIEASETALRLFMMVTKPYRLGFLKYSLPSLSEQDAAKLLIYAWTSSESPNSDPNLSKAKLLELFRSIEPAKLMGEEEFRRFQELDDVVTIYRGVTPHNAKRVKALSWTLDPHTAEWFAHRFGEQGTVYQAQIRKEHILALLLGRNESEVIVDPKYLMGLTTTGTSMELADKHGLDMTMGGM